MLLRLSSCSLPTGEYQRNSKREGERTNCSVLHMPARLLLAFLLPSNRTLVRNQNTETGHTCAIATPAKYGSFEKPSQFRPPYDVQLLGLSIGQCNPLQQSFPVALQLVQAGREHQELLTPCLYWSQIRTCTSTLMYQHTKSISPSIHQSSIPS